MSASDSELREAVLARCTYSPRAGELLRKPGPGVKAGARIGAVDSGGRLQATITVKGRKVRCQVDGLIWLLHYGKRPSRLLHVDGNPLNNRIDNLREKPMSTRTNNNLWRSCLKHGVETGQAGARCSECISERPRKRSEEEREAARARTLARLGPRQFGFFKTCARCGQDGALEDFYKDKNKGRHAYCKKCMNEVVRAHYFADPKRAKERGKDWLRRNPGKRAEYSRRSSAKRKAILLHRAVAWSDEDKIKAIYAGCPPGYEVDHIVPLQGQLVSGLHVENNLQYLTKSDNSRKQNRYSPEIEVFGGH